jgi:hypothetical protein
MMTTSTTRRSTTLKVLAPLVAAGLLASACGSDDDGDDDAAPADTSASGDTTPAGTAAPGDTAGSGGGEDIDGPEIRLRAQDFSESITITEVYGQFLESKGYEVEILTPAGFRTEALDGLANDDFDLIIDYIGGTQAALAPDEPASADPRVLPRRRR